MIAVAANECADIFFVPIRKEQMIIIARLSADPAVEGFIHHDEAEAIGDVEQFRSGRVMTGANSVTAHFFECFELTFECAAVNGGAERAEVMVIANAVQRNTLAVQKEAVVSGE